MSVEPKIKSGSGHFLSLNLLPHSLHNIVLNSFAVLMVMFAIFDDLLTLAVWAFHSFFLYCRIITESFKFWGDLLDAYIHLTMKSFAFEYDNRFHSQTIVKNKLNVSKSI